MADIQNIVTRSDKKNRTADNKGAIHGAPNSLLHGNAESIEGAAAEQRKKSRKDDGNPSGKGVMSGSASRKEASQVEAAMRLSGLAGASVTEKLLGLDLRPTMPGALEAPPGNIDFLRQLSPAIRRTIMRDMLAKQRKRMRSLARHLKDEQDRHENGSGKNSEGKLLNAMNGDEHSESGSLANAIEELGRSAKMLDVLDELLSLQDYTISQIGTFSKG